MVVSASLFNSTYQYSPSHFQMPFFPSVLMQSYTTHTDITQNLRVLKISV